MRLEHTPGGVNCRWRLDLWLTKRPAASSKYATIKDQVGLFLVLAREIGL